jgi:hypothetical protein
MAEWNDPDIFARGVNVGEDCKTGQYSMRRDCHVKQLQARRIYDYLSSVEVVSPSLVLRFNVIMAKHDSAVYDTIPVVADAENVSILISYQTAISPAA